MIGGISGNLGGVNFASSTKRPIVRQLRRRPAQNSFAQAEPQTFLKQVIKQWNDLSTANKNKWNTIAADQRWTDRLAQARQPTGREAFIYMGLFWARIAGFTSTFKAPTLGTAPPVSGLSLSTTGGTTITLNYTLPATGAANVYVFFYARPWYASSTPPHSRKLTFITFSNTGDGPASNNFDYSARWVDHWPMPTAGLQIELGARVITSQNWAAPLIRARFTYA